MDDVDRLRSMFSGAEVAHGVCIAGKSNGKEKVKGRLWLEKEPVTKELWENHVNGVRGLGIIPIFNKNKCIWGCIDIDAYPSPVDEIRKIIKDKDYPLNLCYSKSGGLHVYLNMTEAVLASQMRIWLKSFASRFGLDPGIEIFPKEDSVSEDGYGHWVNMPFFGNTRLGISPEGKEQTLSKFLKDAKLADAESLEKALAIAKSPLGSDAPPCLQRMIENGRVTPGIRNIFLANAAVLFRKEGRNNLAEEIRKANYDFCLPQIDESEVVGIAKSMTKKPYDYQCSQLPYCDHATCIKRKFGIGNAGSWRPERITKYEEENGEFTYEVVLLGKEKVMLLSEEDYANQTKYRYKCLSYHDSIPPKMSDGKWTDELNSRQELVVFVPLELGTRKLDRLKIWTKRYIDQNEVQDQNEIRADKAGAWTKQGLVSFPKAQFREWLVSNKQDFTAREVTALFKQISGLSEVGCRLNVIQGDKHTTVQVYRIPLSCLEDSNSEGEPS